MLVSFYPASDVMYHPVKISAQGFIRQWLDAIRERIDSASMTEAQRDAWEKMAQGVTDGKLPPEMIGGRVMPGTGKITGGRQGIREFFDLHKEITGKLPSPYDSEGLYSLAFDIASADRAIAEADTKRPSSHTEFYTDARKIDRLKGGKPYWATDIELFARAFESYVQDRVEHDENKSQYLVHSTNSKAESAPYAYPRGDERKGIDETFDRLFAEIKTRATDNGTALYSTVSKVFKGDRFTPWADVPVEEIQDIFPEHAGWKVGRDADGAVFVKNADGVGFLVEAVDEIGADSLSFAASRGREMEDGEVVKGRYTDGRITIRHKAGDKWTFAHEAEHALEDLGFFTKDEIEALGDTVKGLHKDGKLPFTSAFDEAKGKDEKLLGGKEDRARYVEWALAKRDFDRKTFVGQVLQRLADWGDGLVNLIKKTGLSVVRSLEKGRIQARRPTVVEAARNGSSAVDYATASQTGPQVTRDLEEDRSFANRLFEQKDVGVQQARTDVMKLQKRLQQLAGAKKMLGKGLVGFDEYKRTAASDTLDMALMVWRDVGGDMERVKKFRTWAKAKLVSPLTTRKQRLKIGEQLSILDRVEKLTDEEKAFADEIGARFDGALAVARANKVVQSHVDDYVRRIWSFPEKRQADFTGGTGNGYGFKVSTTAARKRSDDIRTILDGWEKGYELAVKGLTNSWGTYAEELEVVLANKDFLRNGYETRDASGQRLFDTTKRTGYAELKAPGFSVYEWAGDIKSAGVDPDAESAIIVNDYGRKFFVAPVKQVPERWAAYKAKGDTRAARVFDTQKEADEWAALNGDADAWVEHRPAHEVAEHWEKRTLYAPAELAGMINKMTAIDELFRQTPGASWLARFNSALKSWILLSSFFHHMAGTRSWAFGVDHRWIAGRKMRDPLTGKVYKSAGVNPVKAYKAGFQKIMDNHPHIMMGVKNGLTLGEIADWNESSLRAMPGIIESLAESAGFGPAVKAIRGIKRRRENFETSLFGRYFAGLKAEAFVHEYIGMLQEQHEAHLAGKGPAPDADKVAEIAARIINEDFGGLHLGRMGRNPTLQKLIRLVNLAPDWTESNFRMATGLVPGLNEAISKAVGDIPPPPGMPARYRKFFTKVLVRSVVTTMALQALLNGPDDTWEFWKEQMADWRNFKRFRWAGVDVTKIYRLFGQDLEDGERKVFSVAGHFLDPLKVIDLDRLIINKGAPVVKIVGALGTGRDYAGRPFTGTGEFLATGKTVDKSHYEPTVGFWNRLPATVANVTLSMQPIQVQAALQGLRGEDDALTSILQAGGIHMQNVFAAPETAAIRTENEAVKTELERLAKSGAFTMGPPGRNYAKGGMSIKMTPSQYRAYVDESSRLAEPRLKRYVESPGWARLSDEKKARAFKKVIERARKKAKVKVLREAKATRIAAAA